MASPMRDDHHLVATDDEPVSPEPDAPAVPADPEAPEHDALEQSAEVTPGWRTGRLSGAFDAPEADALEQATDVPGEIDIRDLAPPD